MKQQVYRIIDEMKDSIISLGDELYKHPELGFKEFKSKEIIVNELNKHNFDRQTKTTTDSSNIYPIKIEPKKQPTNPNKVKKATNKNILLLRKYNPSY